MIETAIRLVPSELISKKKLERIEVTYDANGHLLALSWLYETVDDGLYKMAKRRKGEWNSDAGGWTFSNSSVAQDLLAEIVKRHPDWPIIGHPDKPFLPLNGIRISPLSFRDGLDACLIPIPLPYFSHVPEGQHVFQLASNGNKKEEVGLLIGSTDAIAAAVDSMRRQGAICDAHLARKWPLLEVGSNLHVKSNGWTLQVECDLSNPFHYLLAPRQEYHRAGRYPTGTRVAIPWTGKIYTTRKRWPVLKAKILSVGLEWDGDDPVGELSIPATFNANLVAGWATPAPNGHLMHAYQKEGAEFCARRGMRALIGDEMGVGKTVQAIAAAQACASPRILVVCPANARYVWDQEIRGWGGTGMIQHITSQLDKLDMSARWHIVTYDLIAARSQTWLLKDEQEENAFIATFPNQAKMIEKKRGDSYPHKVSLDKPLIGRPDFADPKRIAVWEKMMQRLRGELLEQILAVGPLLTILDEAHRVKNRTANRTKAIQRIAAGETQMLMLTGTPLRNNEHEAAVLLSLLDNQATSALSKAHGYTIEDIKDYLGYFMIRRTKAEVLPELPEKTRQRIDISDLDPVHMTAYQEAMNWALESYILTLKSGKSAAEARQSMQGGIARARMALGVAKVLGGEVSDLVQNVVENKGCCVVFCAHHDVSDKLKIQLEQEKLSVAVVDGRTSQKDRAEIVTEFQEGRLDVFIGGINAAGEAITLTRADTVIFVEMDWVPAALLQAEDRIHRVGQQSNCQVIQLIARMAGGNNLDEMMIELIGSKMARIGSVLDEDTTNIISGSIQAQLHERLLAGTENETALAPAVNDTSPPTNSIDQKVVQEVLIPIPTTTTNEPSVEKRNRGRPKVYIDKAPPTATERSKQSLATLTNSGGKRVMLRLTPEAHEALKVIMEITGGAQETVVINQALVARKNELLQAYTKN